MYPELFRLGQFSVSSYGLMVGLAFVTAYLLTSRELKRKGERAAVADEMLIWVAVCGLTGAKIFFIAQNFTFAEITAGGFSILYSRSGMTFYGGLIGGLAAGIFVARRNGIAVWKALDAAAPGLAIAYAIGRIGCLLVGDDYGIASDLPWAMAFPDGSPPTEIPVHPTQIYETLSMSLVFAVLWKLREFPKPDGQLFSLYMLLAGTERFLVEFIRTTTESPIPGISLAQIIAASLIAAGAAKLWLTSRRKTQDR